MAKYRLTQRDARLTALAISYHLARPGAEIDRHTQQPLKHGLAEVAQTLDGQLQEQIATIDLSDDQRRSLLNAMSGSINELKAYALMPSEGTRRHSAAPLFDQALDRLFPELAGDPDEAVQLAAHLLALRRKLESPG
jgi:hypothetical protein